MNCDKCNSERIFGVSAKVSDRGLYEYDEKEQDGYAPDVDNVCGGDYITIDVCLECGKVQGEFPVTDPEFDDDEEEGD